MAYPLEAHMGQPYQSVAGEAERVIDGRNTVVCSGERFGVRVENPLAVDNRATQKILWGLVETAREKYHESRRSFDLVISEITSGALPSDALLHMERVAKERKMDHQKYMRRLHILTAYLMK